ncbi:protein containing Transposase, IS605 OrfB, partial [gut metagenome]
WKQNINLGKVNNQNFVNIPFNRLIQMIRYKAEAYGIKGASKNNQGSKYSIPLF